MLFVSYDISASTAYKESKSFSEASSKNDGWIDFFHNFFSSAKTSLETYGADLEEQNKLNTWKFVGDEVIVACTISSINQLRPNMEAASHVLEDLDRQVSEGSNTSCRVKAAAWITLVDGKQSVRIQDGKDYIGPVMDAGFRVGTYLTKPGELALSAELAYILAKEYESDTVFYFLGYQVLKGIWKGKPYPIIWYYAPDGEATPDNKPYYFEFELKQQEFHVEPKKSRVCEGESITTKLTEVFSDVGIKRTKDIEDFLKSDEAKKQTGREFRRINVELHNAAVCVAKGPRVLLHWRGRRKKILPDKWACPGGQINLNEDLGASCKRKVKQEANLDVEPKPDVVVPFFIRKSDGAEIGINGFRVLCLVADTEAEKEIAANEDEKWQWYTREELEKLDESDCVPGLQEEIQRLLDLHKDIISQL